MSSGLTGKARTRIALSLGSRYHVEREENEKVLSEIRVFQLHHGLSIYINKSNYSNDYIINGKYTVT